MVTIDFSHCKTVEDVEKVWKDEGDKILKPKDIIEKLGETQTRANVNHSQQQNVRKNYLGETSISSEEDCPIPPADTLRGCGEYFQYGVGEFICGGGLYVHGKRKLCPKCEELNAQKSIEMQNDKI